ncbi:MAG TPA: rhodanese-like domain-containing protein [Polyangiaceae bacterium]|nr:rhodanese-like domain-containing protein [Polyangiaceae bacterium]
MKEAQALLGTGELEVIDVREPHEWLTGHIEGARLLPLGTFRQNPKAAALGDAVLFVCAAGVRSETAARLALSHGIKRVFNLVGGTRAWAGAGLPLVREEYASTAAE